MLADTIVHTKAYRVLDLTHVDHAAARESMLRFVRTYMKYDW